MGRAVAEALAAEGMSLTLMARSRAQLEEATAACAAAGGRAIAVAIDVCDAGSFLHAVEGVEADLGPVDLLVSNAGVQGPGTPLWEAGFEEWWRVTEVNLGGALAGAAAVLPGMVGRGHAGGEGDLAGGRCRAGPARPLERPLLLTGEAAGAPARLVGRARRLAAVQSIAGLLSVIGVVVA